MLPENSLEAFQYALNRQDCAGIELDIRLSADQQLVIHHDAALNPAFCKDDAGSWVQPGRLIADFTLTQLNHFTFGELNPAHKHHYVYANRAEIKGVKVATLQQVLELAASQRPGFTVVVELKSAILKRVTNAPELVLSLVDTLKPFSATLQLMVCSFDWRLLQLVAAKAPELKLLFTTHPLSLLGLAPLTEHFREQAAKPYYQKLQQRIQQGPVSWWGELTLSKDGDMEDLARFIKASGGSYWFCHASDVSAELLALTQRLDLQLAVWGVEDHDMVLWQQQRLPLPDLICVDKPGFEHTELC
ncbi:hypothetical protein RLON56S_01179 [Alishewanella longhuensis]